MPWANSGHGWDVFGRWRGTIWWFHAQYLLPKEKTMSQSIIVMMALLGVNSIALSYLRKARSSYPFITKYIQDATVTTLIGRWSWENENWVFRYIRWNISQGEWSKWAFDNTWKWLSRILYVDFASSNFVRKVPIDNNVFYSIILVLIGYLTLVNSAINMHKV